MEQELHTERPLSKNAVMMQNTKNIFFIQNEAGEGIFFRRVSRVLPVHLVEVT